LAVAARPSVDDLWHLAATISADADTMLVDLTRRGLE
jgi:hypothetical protein